MAYTSSANELAFDATYAPARAATKAAAKATPQRGFFGRAFDAMLVARMRQAEREIALYINGTGGKFTDEAEREIERRFLSASSRW